MKRYLPSPALIAILLFLLITGSFVAKADEDPQKGTVRGRVLTQDNKPAENVSATLKGTKYGTVTDEDGEFQLRVPAGNYTLVVSHLGYKPVEQAIAVKGGTVDELPNITLISNSTALNAVNISAVRTNKFYKKSSDDVAKMPLDNLENPQVYTTIPQSVLTDQLSYSVDDAMKNATGVQKMWEATGRSGDGGSYYNSRGFIMQSQLRDGIAGNISNTVDAANLESIEVIKGPSATLFGSSLTSYGGLINRITKKPYDQFGGQVTYALGSYNLNRISADLNTPIDSAKKLLFRLNTAFNYQGSYQNNGFNRNFSVDPSLLYKINDRLSILLDAEIYAGNGTEKSLYFFPFGKTIAALGASRADQLDIDWRNTYNNGDLTEQSHNANFFGRVNYKISDQWKSQTDITATHSYSNGFGPYYYLLSKDSVSRNDQSTKNSTQDVFEIQQNFTGDFKIGSLRNRFVGGLDYFHNNSNQFFFGSTLDTVRTNNPGFNYSTFNKASMNAIYANSAPGFTYPAIYKTDTYSAYAADVLNITDKLIAMAAIRGDRFINKGNHSPATQTTSGAYSQTAFSPKFGLVYQPVKDQVSLFVNFQNGFTNENGTDYAGKPFKPEEANQVEGGVKLDAFGGRLSSTISYYRIEVQDVVRPYPGNPNFSVQDGTQLSKGFEAQVIANPFRGFNVLAGFSYNDSKYTKADADIEGRRPGTASSPYQANLWLSYRLPQEIVRGLGFGFGGNYASDNEVINSVSQGVFTLPSYTILNASVFLDRPKYRIGLAVNNLTNKEYWIGYTTVNPQLLRQVTGSITFKF